MVLVEGPPDMISARSRGLPAVAVPGDDAWEPGWARLFAGRRVSGYRHHPREIQRLMFVATDPERWCQDGWVAFVNDVT